MNDNSDGAYVFTPEIEADGFSRSYQYSQIDSSVQFQQGKNLQ